MSFLHGLESRLQPCLPAPVYPVANTAERMPEDAVFIAVIYARRHQAVLHVVTQGVDHMAGVIGNSTKMLHERLGYSIRAILSGIPRKQHMGTFTGQSQGRLHCVESITDKGHRSDAGLRLDAPVFMPPDPDVRILVVDENIFDAEADNLSATASGPLKDAPDKTKFRTTQLACHADPHGFENGCRKRVTKFPFGLWGLVRCSQ